MAKIKVSEVAYSGSQGNIGVAFGVVNGAVASGDVIDFGKLPSGIGIKRVSAGTSKANASAVGEVKITKDDGTEVSLASALDLNNKMSAKDLTLYNVGFDHCGLTLAVTGGAIAKGSNLTLYIEYVTLGTQ